MRVEKLFLRYAITPAQLLYESTPARMKVSAKRGEMKIEREPLKLTIDNRAFLDEIGIKSHATQAREYAQRGRQAARDAVGRYAREGNMMLGPDAMSPAQIVAARGKATARSELKFIPADKPKLSWSGGDVKIRTERDDIDIEWQPHNLDFRYIPYSIEYYLDKW
jgi:hypothetical protein